MQVPVVAGEPFMAPLVTVHDPLPVAEHVTVQPSVPTVQHALDGVVI